MILVLSMGLLLYYFEIFSIKLIVISTLIVIAYEAKLWIENEKKFKEEQMKENEMKNNIINEQRQKK